MQSATGPPLFFLSALCALYQVVSSPHLILSYLILSYLILSGSLFSSSSASLVGSRTLVHPTTGAYTLLLVTMRTLWVWLARPALRAGAHGQADPSRAGSRGQGPGVRGQGPGGSLARFLSEQALVRVANQPCHPSLQPDRDDTASARDDGHGHIDQRFQALCARDSRE